MMTFNRIMTQRIAGAGLATRSLGRGYTTMTPATARGLRAATGPLGWEPSASALRPLGARGATPRNSVSAYTTSAATAKPAAAPLPAAPAAVRPVIHGIATGVPPNVEFQKDLLRDAVSNKRQYPGLKSSKMGRDELLTSIFTSSRIHKRHMSSRVTDTLAAPRTIEDRMKQFVTEGTPLAVETAREAMRKAGAKPEEIEKLVFVSSSGFAAPGVDSFVVDQLGLPRTVSRTNIGFMGCGGAVNGLHAMGDFCAAEPGKKALLICLEIHSIHRREANTTNDAVANAIFGDGCAAVVMSGEEPKDARGKWAISGRQSYLMEDSHNAVTISLKPEGLAGELSTELSKCVRGGIRGFVDSFLEKQGLDGQDDIDLWGVHPGGTSILNAVADGLELDSEADMEHSWGVLRDYGNMSSSTVLFVLDRLLSDDKAAKSDRAIAMAFAPGVTVEGAMLEKC